MKVFFPHITKTYDRQGGIMNKKIWLMYLLLVLASLDVIGMDTVRTRAQANAFMPDTGEGAGNTQNVKEEGDSADGAAPETIAEEIRSELRVFPIPLSVTHPEYRSVFENSWMSPRSFGGERGHEGVDIMLYPGERGLFPVLSMTDGVVEKKGWLPQGGYRLGVRSAGGIYYYYAHLYDYAPNIEEGTPVAAGQLLGFAGDSGYSNIEGTVGNFAVHLHVGIYYNDEAGAETSINPYGFLVLLEDRKREMEF